MAIPMFDLEQIPAFHEDILILKVRSLPNAVEHKMAPEGAAATTTLSSPEVTKALEGAPGLQTLCSGTSWSDWTGHSTLPSSGAEGYQLRTTCAPGRTGSDTKLTKGDK
jgi:hypothetical protein